MGWAMVKCYSQVVNEYTNVEAIVLDGKIT
jgi:hypothetical protein